ncbi:hypothetical protein C6N75_02005 [Streptomyces solincola]|uniref:DUF5302 domain-containing protein n=1 Tax=Streptomyces solincola TaxID=2100817 RepID=A0A2S9Q2F9_9ACTN|nr:MULTISPECIES: DUF5302 domain-containing protein [Streptomyces]PRH80832.1 hypothetical protein C6N75_02005 [Streptomyces solincola]
MTANTPQQGLSAQSLSAHSLSAATPSTHDDDKLKFKRALEQKSRLTRNQQAHEEGRMRVKNMSGAAGQKRFFRRKTG